MFVQRRVGAVVPLGLSLAVVATLFLGCVPTASAGPTTPTGGSGPSGIGGFSNITFIAAPTAPAFTLGSAVINSGGLAAQQPPNGIAIQNFTYTVSGSGPNAIDVVWQATRAVPSINYSAVLDSIQGEISQLTANSATSGTGSIAVSALFNDPSNSLVSNSQLTKTFSFSIANGVVTGPPYTWNAGLGTPAPLITIPATQHYTFVSRSELKFTPTSTSFNITVDPDYTTSAFASVPAPSSFLLAILGFAPLVWFARRRRPRLA